MDVSLYSALATQYDKQDLEIAISETVYSQIGVSLTQGNDTLRLYLNREQLEQLFGKINQFFEDTAIPQKTVNDIAKEMAESEAPYSLA